MDRKMLVGLFQEGIQYSLGRHRLWISRCFEINVRPNQVVELDEYESFSAEKAVGSDRSRWVRKAPKKKQEMFHVGRSILDLKDGRVVEESGAGWKK